jgi:hypothetical protein
MKVPKAHQAWPNIYRYGFEDGESNTPSVEDRFIAKAALAYVAGYIAGDNKRKEHDA